MSKLINFVEMGIVEPNARIKQLGNYGNMVEVDPNIPIRRYFRSGMEMVRMANVYLSEGNLENAYILYIKFMTLFIEKIKSHPEYKNTPAAMKQPNITKLKEVLPITEKLKLKLLEIYQKDYSQFLTNKEMERIRELEKAREQAEYEKNNRGRVLPQPPPAIIDGGGGGGGVQPIAPDLSMLDQVVYPNDFPSDNNRPNLPSGLILPDSPANQKPRPSIDRTLKPSSNLLSDGGLRTVIIPKDTMDKFLRLCNSNTINNIETCGVLAGKLSHNRLLITHVIIPKQKGTPDSCNTMNEEEIFDIQDQHNLITLGWIHTHPSQTAFLSSVDLHTHCAYQMMMPEAVAIVCAPKYKTTGFFCLTPGYGLDYIAQCRLTGFHPHPNDPPLFMESQHVALDDGSAIDVIDLRR